MSNKTKIRLTAKCTEKDLLRYGFFKFERNSGGWRWGHDGEINCDVLSNGTISLCSTNIPTIQWLCEMYKKELIEFYIEIKEPKKAMFLTEKEIALIEQFRKMDAEKQQNIDK